MDNLSRFDLSRELARWRQVLSAREGITPERAWELETHLHEAIAEWQAKGLTEEEAFWISARRMGDADALAVQFNHADPAGLWHARIFWMAFGILMIPVLQFMIGILGGSAIYLCAKYNVPIPGAVIALLATFVFIGGMVVLIRGLAGGRWPFISQALETFCSRRRQFAWQLLLLAALPLVVGAIGFAVLWWLRVNGWTPETNDVFVSDAGVRLRAGFRTIFISQAVLWPFVVAFLAAKYAPVRRGPGTVR